MHVLINNAFIASYIELYFRLSYKRLLYGIL